jgi:hypothetical protein
MAQLDFFSYSEQYFLVSSTFWLFYVGCSTLLIAPFLEVMKMRRLISESICIDDEELSTDKFFSLSVMSIIMEENSSLFL